MSTMYKLVLDGVVYVLGENEVRARQVAAERGGRLVKVEEPDPSESSNI
jgi:hypothetical protein